MSSNFPISLDNSTSLPYPAALSKRNSPSLASLSDNQNDSIIATQTKLGISSSTPTNNNLLIGTGVGTSAWTKAAPTGTIVGTTDSQTLTNKILTSPTINSPIITNATITTDLITGFTTSNTGSIYGVSVAAGVINSAALLNSVNTAAIQSSAVDYTKVATGFAVQVVSTNYSAVATGTTIIPYDDTIPQITEGTEFMTQAITPKSATNRLSLEVNISCDLNATGDTIVALFQDSTANALAAASVYTTTANGESVITIRYDMVAGTVSSTTFRVRGGGSVASTFTFNGFNAARRFGGITLSNIKITEYKA